MASRFIMPRQGVKGQNLSPADGAKLYFKVIGQGIGGTDKDIFTDEGVSVPATNPVIADATGLFEELWQSGDYDTFLTDKNDNQLWGPETVRSTSTAATAANNYTVLADAITDAANLSIGDSFFIDARSTGEGGISKWLVVDATTAAEDEFEIVTVNATISFQVILEPEMFVSVFDVKDSTESSGAFQVATNKVALTKNEKTTITSTTINILSNRTVQGLPGSLITNTTDNDIFEHVTDADDTKVKIFSVTAIGNPTGTNQYFANLSSLNSCEVSKCDLTECTQGIHFSACINYESDKNIIEGGRRGILVEGESDLGRIQRNKIRDTDEACIKILGGNDILIEDNECTLSKDTGIVVSGYTGQRIKIIRNFCHSNGTTGSLKQGINTHGVTDSEVSYNICRLNASNGIDISGHLGDPFRGGYTKVIGNTCIDNLGKGLVIFTTEKTLVQGNILRGNDQNLVIQGAGGGYDIEVCNNYCFDSTDTSPRANIFINQVDGTCYIHDNYIGEDHEGARGVHDGAGNAAVLTDSVAQWTIDEWSGDTLTNATDGSSGSSTSNTVNTNTAALGGGTDNDWDVDDIYEIGVVTMFGLYLDGAITGKIILGYNNFDACANPKPVQMTNVINDIELTDAVKQVYYSTEIDLSGAAFKVPVPAPQIDKFSFLHKVRIKYVEGTSADAGITVGIGDGGASLTKWATGTTEINKSSGDELLITLNRRGRIDENTSFFFHSAGGKVGAGSVIIICEYAPLIPVNF